MTYAQETKGVGILGKSFGTTENMEASSISPGIPPPPPVSSSMYSVKRSFSTPCDPRDDEDGCNIHLSQRLAKTPPLTPKKGGKMLALKIHLLDDTVTIIQAQVRENELSIYILSLEFTKQLSVLGDEMM